MACLLCKSHHVKRIDKFCDNMKILGDSFPDTPSYINVCTQCGLVYVDMDVKQEDILQYYTSGNCMPICYEELFGAEYTKKYFEHIYDTIKPFINVNSNILDVGGGRGEFADFLSKKGYKNVTILDPAQSSVDSAMEKGVRVLKADSSYYIEEWEEKYDLILLIHVFEHIYDQNETLCNLKRMLKHNGIIYLEVPDATKFCSDDQVPFYYYTYEHVAHMNRHDIQNIARIMGLELLEIQEYMKCDQYPAVYGLYKKGEGDVKEAIYSDLGKKFAEEYLELSKIRSRKMTKKFIETKQPLVLWGIGASTAQLLSCGFEQCNVSELVDNNPKRQGIVYSLGDRKLQIISPEALKHKIKKDDIIVVMSIMYKSSIIRQITDLGFENRIGALSTEDMI